MYFKRDVSSFPVSGGYFIVVSEDDERLREDDERSRMAAVAVFAPGRARLKATFTLFAGTSHTPL